MRARCENPHNPGFPGYGGRGITICDRWHNLVWFVEDIERELGPRPEGCSLDRVDNDGPYAPGNVRWATAREQLLNRRTAGSLTRGIAELEKQNALLAFRLRAVDIAGREVVRKG